MAYSNACTGTWIGPEAIVCNAFEVLGRNWIDHRVDLGWTGRRVMASTARAPGLPTAARA